MTAVVHTQTGRRDVARRVVLACDALRAAQQTGRVTEIHLQAVQDAINEWDAIKGRRS